MVQGGLFGPGETKCNLESGGDLVILRESQAPEAGMHLKIIGFVMTSGCCQKRGDFLTNEQRANAAQGERSGEGRKNEEDASQKWQVSRSSLEQHQDAEIKNEYLKILFQGIVTKEGERHRCRIC